MIICKIRFQMAKNKIDDISDLMKKSSLSRNAINRLYKEKDIDATSLKTLTKLCDTFKCSLSELLEYVPDME